MILIVMFVYQYIITTLDFIYLLIQSAFTILFEIYRLFDPPKRKSVVGEVVLITGAGHGLGRELALQFARLGAKIVCLDINEEWNKATVSQIEKEGGTVWGFWCDVSRRDEIRSVSDQIREMVGDVTILVNNAGIMPCKPLIRHTADEVERLFRVNVLSQIWMIQEWLPTFKKNSHGHIVALSSICGIMGTPNLVPYCSSKFAITGLMEALMEELRYGNQNPNIKCTRVHPYTVDTGLAKKPRIKFPSLNGILKAEKCAEIIIDRVRQNEDIVFIPSHMYYMNKLLMIFPRKFHLAFYDFMDTGVDAHDE